MQNDIVDLGEVAQLADRLQPGEHLYYAEPDGKTFLARFTPHQKRAVEMLYLDNASVGRVLDYLDTRLAEGPFCSSWEVPPGRP